MPIALWLLFVAVLVDLPRASSVAFTYRCPSKHHIVDVSAATGTVSGRTIITAMRFRCSNQGQSPVYGGTS